MTTDNRSEDTPSAGVEGVGSVVRVESARQTVILVFGLVGSIMTVYIVRKLNDPDALSTFKMWGALTVKRWADRQSARFARLATHMANVYNGEKL